MPPSELAVDSTGKKLNEFEVQECVEELRMLILANPRFKVRTDSAFLLRYLHCTGFRVCEALKRIQEMNDLKLEYLDWFAHSPPSDHSLVMSWNIKTFLKGRDRFGRRIYLSKVANVDTSATSMARLAQYDDLWLEAVLDEPDTQAAGICIIVDMAGFSWKMFRWLSPGNVRIGTKRAEMVPVKKTVYHIVNSSMLLNATVALVFPFLSSKTKEHIHFHYENWPSLHKYIDPEYLPVEYGGTKKTVEYEEMNKWLCDQTPRLIENFKNDYRM